MEQERLEAARLEQQAAAEVVAAYAIVTYDVAQVHLLRALGAVSSDALLGGADRDKERE